MVIKDIQSRIDKHKRVLKKHEETLPDCKNIVIEGLIYYHEMIIKELESILLLIKQNR